MKTYKQIITQILIEMIRLLVFIGAEYFVLKHSFLDDNQKLGTKSLHFIGFVTLSEFSVSNGGSNTRLYVDNGMDERCLIYISGVYRFSKGDSVFIEPVKSFFSFGRKIRIGNQECYTSEI